jgi:hypothetical protein
MLLQVYVLATNVGVGAGVGADAVGAVFALGAWLGELVACEAHPVSEANAKTAITPSRAGATIGRRDISPLIVLAGLAPVQRRPCSQC